VLQPGEGLRTVPGEPSGSSIPGAGRGPPADPSRVGAVCVCTRGCVGARVPVPWRLGQGVCHHDLRPPPGPRRGSASWLGVLVRSLPGDTATRKVAGGL